jgi:hypothetical protein
MLITSKFIDTEQSVVIVIIFSIRTPPSSSTADDEQKSIYKRVLRGGDIPAVGFQRRLLNNRGRHMVDFVNVYKNIGNSCNCKEKGMRNRNQKFDHFVLHVHDDSFIFLDTASFNSYKSFSIITEIICLLFRTLGTKSNEPVE